MSEAVKEMWLHEEDGTKVAPRTLITCIQDEDGDLFEDYANSILMVSQDETTEIPEDLVTSITSQDIHNIVSDAYDNTKTYSVRDYCIKDNVLYKCNTAVEIAEEFDDAKWTATTCASEFDSLNNKLSKYEYLEFTATGTGLIDTGISSTDYDIISVVAVDCYMKPFKHYAYSTWHCLVYWIDGTKANENGTYTAKALVRKIT